MKLLNTMSKFYSLMHKLFSSLFNSLSYTLKNSSFCPSFLNYYSTEIAVLKYILKE